LVVAVSALGGDHLAALAVDLQHRLAQVQVHAVGVVEIVLAQGQGSAQLPPKYSDRCTVVGALALFAEHMHLEALEGATADQLFDAMVADHAVADDDQSLPLCAARCCLHKPILDQKKKGAWSRSSRRLPVFITVGGPG
jgi:hypothetical protein